MKIIGVTGTNGKTTTAEFIRQMMSVRQKVVSMGTLGLLAKDHFDFEPRIFNADDFLQYLQEMKEQFRPDLFIFEAYSTALSMNIYPDDLIDVAILTNIREDHLDFHDNLNHYIASKMKLFSQVLKRSGTAVFCEEDEHAELVRVLCAERKIRIITYGYSAKADIRISLLESRGGTTHLTIKNKGTRYQYRIPFTGDIFVMNWLGALCTFYALTDQLTVDAAQLNNLALPPGRKELITEFNGCKVYLDYAHNADGFRSILRELRKETTNRLHVVFGCGGNRYVSRRFTMGQIAREFADKVYVTSDNPRDEDPQKIIQDILSACPSAWSHPDRKIAISKALECLQPEDTLVIAGKGHENHQQIGSEKFHHSDKEVVLSLTDQE